MGLAFLQELTVTSMMANGKMIESTAQASSQISCHSLRTTATFAICGRPEFNAGNAKLQNGDRYTGEFQDGLAHGQGRVVSASKERYEGDFVAGKRHGQGRCILANGDKYSGMASSRPLLS